MTAPPGEHQRDRIERWGPRGRAVLITVLLVLLIAGPTAAWAGWHAQAALAPATASAGVVGAPANLQCESKGGLLGFAQYVELSWDEPARGAPDRYVIEAQAEGETYLLGEIDGEAERTFEIRAGLLTGLLTALLDLILAGEQPEITVVALHDSGWESAATDSVAIRLSLLGLGGLRCA